MDGFVGLFRLLKKIDNILRKQENKHIFNLLSSQIMNPFLKVGWLSHYQSGPMGVFNSLIN